MNSPRDIFPLTAIGVGAALCLATLSSPTHAACTSQTWSELGEIYQSGVRYGNGFDTTQQCLDYAKTQATKLADGATQTIDFSCHARITVRTTCKAEVVVKATPGIGKLPANPRINAGFSDARIVATSEVAAPPRDGTGDFRTRCTPSHFAYDDPIVFPGQVGRSHMHMFFGNTGANAASTAESLRTTGNSTCRGGILNRSSYWVPAVIDTATDAPVVPNESDFYYKQGYKGVKAADIQPMPQGLRMIAGDPMSKTENPYTSVYVFLCHNMDYPANRSQNIPKTCPVGDQLEMSIAFPQCWDGVNLDSPDHKSHMAYASAETKGCPATHPVALPEVSFHVLYPVPADGDMSKWRLASDAAGYPSGLSAHADWFNGWRKDISDAWGINCDRGAKDCHSHLLGNGFAIY